LNNFVPFPTTKSSEGFVTHKIKVAFAPKSLINPRKAVPELHHCAELGVSYVHHGKLPHPELEHF
jgi:glycolate oxidase